MSLRKQASMGLVWTFAQQFGNQLVSFVISIFLARLLLPAEFGLIGMIAVFYSIGKSLTDSGLSQSLIRSKELNQVDYSTVFYFNLATSCIIYLIIYAFSPLIASFYDSPILINIIRLYCLTFIIGAFSSVQMTKLTKEMKFKIQTLITIPSTIIGGLVGVGMAYMDFGVWSLVWSAIASSLVAAIQLWIYAKWSPSWIFDFKVFKEHFNFGYKLAFSSLLNRVFGNIYMIVIGKYFSAAQVGYYTRADTTKQLPVDNLSNALNKVTFPLFAKIQDDNVRLKRVYRQLMKMVVFIITPILIFLAVLAEPVFRFLFTEKWLPAVPYFQILCFIGILFPIHSYNLNVLKVKGRSDLFLKLAVIKKILVIIAIGLTLPFGIYSLLWGQVVLSIISFVINAHYTDKFLNYSAWSQFKDILPILLLGSFSGFVIYLEDFWISAYKVTDLFRIISGVLVGSLVYILLSVLFKFESFKDLIELILKKNKIKV